MKEMTKEVYHYYDSKLDILADDYVLGERYVDEEIWKNKTINTFI